VPSLVRRWKSPFVSAEQPITSDVILSHSIPQTPPEDTSKGKNFESRMLAVLLPTLPQTHLWYFCCSTEQAVFVQVIVFAESFEV
jgi:hypothetical protein